MKRFANEKRQALARVDRSKKQEIDRRIARLVRMLNKKVAFYTTSSCAGRILLSETGERKTQTRWRLAAHEKTSLREVRKALARPPQRAVYFKQEGFILHVACETAADATRLLTAANAAGVRRRGILSLSPRVIVELCGAQHFEAIVSEKGKLLCAPEYLAALMREANARLAKNWEVIARLEKEARKL